MQKGKISGIVCRFLSYFSEGPSGLQTVAGSTTNNTATTATVSSSIGRVNSATGVATSNSDLEVRLKQMEKNFDSMKQHHSAERVDEAL